MRITNKVIVNTYLSNLLRTESAMQKNNEQVSTGKRINLPSDDPVGTARSMVLNTNVTEFTQFISNSQNAQNWLNSSDQALLGLDKTLQRIYELVVQGTSDTSSLSARESLAVEVEKSTDGIMELANANVDNRYIFGGEKVLNRAYNKRAFVFGDQIDLQKHPIDITLNNSIFKVKLDDGNTKTIVLTPRTYDGTPGKTVQDLADDVQNQLKKAGFALPVYVKVTPENKLQFYAGVNPPDGSLNTLVIKEGPAIKTVGNVVTSAILPGPDTIDLDNNANNNAGYYDGWQVTITSGTGAGQTRTIIPGGYTTLPIKRAQVDKNWNFQPDDTSTYVITPPLEGKLTGVAAAPPPYTIALDADAAPYPGLYDGMDITIMDGAGAGQTRTLHYDAVGLTYEVTIPWATTPGVGASYAITPHQTGTVGAPVVAGLGSNTLQLDANSSSIPDLYNGASITVTDINGVKQTRKITDYDGAGLITVDADWAIDISANATFKISDTALSQLGLVNQTSTKDLVSNELVEPISVTGKYPLNGYVQVPPGPLPGPTDLSLIIDSSNVDDYYKNWTVTITSGKGAGQTSTITGYDGLNRKATVNPPWDPTRIPDDTSIYSINPPTIGVSGVNLGTVTSNAQGGTISTVVLDPLSNSTDNYYNGWYVNTAASGGGVVTAYDGKTKTATVALTGAPAAGDAYTLTPPPGGLAQAGTGFPLPETITLDPGTIGANDYYKGWRIKITDGTGQGQTVDILNYNATTKVATVNPAWTTIPDATSVYSLIPTVAPNQIQLTPQSSAIKDFYVGMPVTITGGDGAGQSRKITAYDPVSRVATVERDWGDIPTQMSSYSIDANYYVNTNSKFKITIAGQLAQEVSLDGGTYNLREFAKHMEAKINVIGGEYANVKVNVTNDNKLRIGYRDPDPNDNDTPKNIKLEMGSNADILLKLGFGNGVQSETPEANYEGDQGTTEYEVSVGVRVQVNTIGDKIFDPVFEHLKKITVDLRAGDSSILTNDIKLVKDDLERAVMTLGEIGAKVNRLEKGVSRLNTLNDNLTELISNVEDTDFAETLMHLQMEQTAYQAALQAGGRILPPTLMDYLK